MRNFAAPYTGTDYEKVVAQLEAATGLSLMKSTPGDAAEVVHGYVSFDGEAVEVHVYQAEDVTALGKVANKEPAVYRHGNSVSSAKIEAALADL